ncbi:MAG TPA: NAD(P)/FAD-dependent oxidoreductase [Actinomycetota bacterium]|nr:NAD(P)/FAD-dependent oxidoreductase [Actinomycetota bacterium]
MTARPAPSTRALRRVLPSDGGSGTEVERYDTIVIGGGHNGLVAAFYLADAGLRTVVLERRELVGGACVTEEIAPGVRASTTSYIASMLRPEVIRDLRLERHGLRMIPCDPGLQVAFEDGTVVPWWTDHERAVAEFAASVSPADAASFDEVHGRLHALARYLQPFFLEEPPNLYARGWAKVREGSRAWRRFRKITGDELADLARFTTGSLGEFVERHFETERMRRMYLANNVYGMHAPPYMPGTAIGLLFHLLSGGAEEVQGFYGHVLGGMGAITQAMAAAVREAGGEIRVAAPVARVLTRADRATGVVLEDGEEIAAEAVLSNADPKRTFLGLVEPSALPASFRDDVAAIKMAGPCAKVNFVLTAEPSWTGMPADADANRRSLATLVPTLEEAQRIYDRHREGEIPDTLWVDCVTASNVDDTLAPPSVHVMTAFVQYVPFELRRGGWDDRRDELLRKVVRRIEEYAPGFGGTVQAAHVVTPLDLERTYGLTEGNIFHGDLHVGQLFSMRPTPAWSRYRTPVRGLYLCGAGAHPGGGVTGAPGYGASHAAIRDLRWGRRAWR